MHALPDLKRTANASAFGLLPNRWDAAALVLIVGMVTMMAIGFEQTTAPMATLSEHPVSLSPAMLPEYALRTTLRPSAAGFRPPLSSRWMMAQAVRQAVA